MVVFDAVIGFRADSLESVASTIHQRFGCVFEQRTSSFLGGDYYMFTDGRETASILSNRDGDEIAEHDFPDHNVLVVVESSKDLTRWKELLQELGGVLVREDQYES